LHPRIRLAAAAAGAALSLSCGVPDTNRAGDELTNAASWPETAGRPSVEPPGPLDQPLAGDDLLVVSDHTLPARVVDRILAITVDGTRGITASERLSIAQFSSENRVYDVAAVDPGGFRRFAGEDADFTPLWRRIAAGEVAVTAASADHLPLDDQGYLGVGAGQDQLRLHVGAYARNQTGTIDALVNAPWGERLGMPAGNALLLSTGAIAPQAVRAQIRKLAPDLSIIALDIVAETGIDPGARQSVTFVGTFADAVGDFRYAVTAGGRVVPDPAWVRSHIITESVPILGAVTCNKHLMPQLRGALTEVRESGLASSIHPGEYAGCYYPRFIAGTTTLSNHAFGLALDLNVPGNLRGTAGEIDRGVVAIFKSWGFAWGGDWSYTDPMHFELSTIVSPDSQLQ
jgi:hypothetical protein